ncbi:hypothetical protein Syun_031312 [Stephania yunnanensis]|uniref:Uncharacterized protein n=1 Tax=Stephania yunnanensis TaxID=152371 RepID=A0AAP0DZ92_9MAGN
MARYNDEWRRWLRVCEGTRGGLWRLQSSTDGDRKCNGLVASTIVATTDFGEKERVDGNVKDSETTRNEAWGIGSKYIKSREMLYEAS